jgi:hypothetical protein
VQDPIGFLDNHGDDWDIACAVVEEAREIQIKQRQEEYKALATGIGNACANAIGQMFRA